MEIATGPAPIAAAVYFTVCTYDFPHAETLSHSVHESPAAIGALAFLPSSTSVMLTGHFG
jgi:hypothetical protein